MVASSEDPVHVELLEKTTCCAVVLFNFILNRIRVKIKTI